MSKKDYQAIARVFHSEKPDTVGEAFATWRNLYDGLADILQAGNERFDRARFVEACETGKTKGMPR